MTYIIVLSLIVFFISIIFILFFIQNNKIKENKYKIDLSFNEINDNLNKKINILDRLINIIEREIKKENKAFNSFKSIKSNKLSEFELDNLLTDTSSLVLNIYNDNTRLSKVKSFDGLIEELREVSNKLVALRTYYNKYTSIYNHLINKITYKLVSTVRHDKSLKYFEGKEIDETIV